MSDQPEHADVAVARLGLRRHALGRLGGSAARQVAPRRDQGGARSVLEAAAAVFERVEQEQVAFEGRPGAAVPEGDLCLAEALRVGEEPLAVEIGQGAGDDELVGHAGRVEAAAPEPAELDRMVDERVVVGCDELVGGGAGTSVERRRHLPARRKPRQRDHVGLAFLPFDPQADAGAVEEPARRIEKRGAHRGVEGVHPVADDERHAGGGARQPARLVELLQRQRRAALLRREARQVTRELAHQVAAGYPGRKAQALLGSGPVDAQLDRESVPVRGADVDVIADHCADCRRRHAAAIRGKMTTMSRLREFHAEDR